MDNLEQLSTINWWYVVFAILLGLVCVKFVWTLLDWLLFEKLGIKTRKMRQREQESELLKTTTTLAKTNAENLDKLREKHIKDEEEFRNNLNNYIEESRTDRKALHDEMSKFAESQESRDIQIEALMCGSKELLGSTIDQLYSKYVELGGVPESEVDEFDDIFHAYKKLNGNHRRDAKYNYVKNHLKVIPVETKLLINNK